MDETILRNLDTQSRRLRLLEDELDLMLREGDDRATARSSGHLPVGTYAELTAANDGVRESRGWADVDPSSALTQTQRDAFAAWNGRQRLPWGIDDVVAVGLATAVGFVATWFDSGLDRAVRQRLAGLKDTELVRSWERDARGLPIDFTGPGFGGPDHRVRSSGHDLGRPIAALRQIRDGVFTGVRWDDGVRQDVRRTAFVPARSGPEALTLWAKHLAADVVTPMSLPLPGFSRLHEMSHPGLRAFAHQVYRGTGWGEGLNVRSGLATPTLAVLATETVVRIHVHGRAATRSGTGELTGAEEALRDELLLASHAATAVAALGKTVARSMVIPTGVMSLRHVNVPVLFRIGMLAIRVRSHAQTRSEAGAPTWGALLTEVEAADADVAECLPSLS